MTIHYALPDQSGRFAPVCGEAGSPNWTILREVVTCPRCLDRMRTWPEEGALAKPR